MRKAFTLIELIVSLGILAVVLSFAGLIFRVSIESHRMALANAEIMQKLRVITEQLDTDFKSVIFDYGGMTMARTRTYTIDGNDIEVNSDSVVFFASGDFQSTQQYGAGNDTIAGNVAAIFYGQPDPNSYDRVPEPRNTVLLRRQTILASEASEDDSDPNGEYYATSLEAWFSGTPRADLAGWIKSPLIEPNDVKANQSMYLARGVHNFTISYLEDGDEIGIEPIAWKRRVQREDDGASSINPYVFKFTFTLYDSRGIIKNGRTFTHIVFVGS
jgi:prepilin-type N-terminal cleavage/methylation domain-containing protein